MAATRPKAPVLAVLVLLVSSAQLSMGARRRMELYQPNPADMLSYHNGAVLHADIFVSVLWYGSFTQVQKTIIYDFLLSLTMMPQAASPSVSQWWNIIDQQYLSKAVQVTPANAGGATKTRVMLDNQVSDDGCSMGTSLTLAQISALVARAKPKKGGVALVFTAQNVTVEGFCMSQCGLHGSDAKSGTTYVWVGNSATQCPGQCAWPFHQPLYGPQSPPLIPPNGDAGVDGMIINLASEFAGVVTNPFRDAYYQGSSDAPLEAATACPGQFGSGSYPGYAGGLKIDQASGATCQRVRREAEREDPEGKKDIFSARFPYVRAVKRLKSNRMPTEWHEGKEKFERGHVGDDQLLRGTQECGIFFKGTQVKASLRDVQGPLFASLGSANTLQGPNGPKDGDIAP